MSEMPDGNKKHSIELLITITNCRRCHRKCTFKVTNGNHKYILFPPKLFSITNPLMVFQSIIASFLLRQLREMDIFYSVI